jgi:hypothetical protein
MERGFELIVDGGEKVQSVKRYNEAIYAVTYVAKSLIEKVTEEKKLGGQVA